MQQFAFALAEEGETLDLDIYSVIGESFWFDSVSAKQVRRRLRESKAKTINVRINSEGGDVIDAADIYDQLKSHSARKVMRVGGLAASAASYILMAGDEIIVGPGAWIMIHNPWGGASGKPDELRDWADVLDKMRDQLAAVYAARTGLPKDKVVELMAAETWLTAEEALNLGFADRIDSGEVATKQSSKARARAQSCFAAASIRDFKNVPPAVLDLVANARRELEQARTPPTPAPQTDPHPSPGARAEQQPPTGDKEKNMAFPKALIAALSIGEDADEAAAVAAVNKLKASAKVGSEIETLVGAAGPAALGAVRALKASQEANAELGNKVAQLQAVNARRDFEGARDQGLKDRKLTPATAKLYSDRFEACLKDESVDADARAANASAIVEDLKGFLAVAPRVVAVSLGGPPPTSGESSGPMQHNGKAFEAMNGIERKRLKDENPELYASMREDAVARGAI